MSSFGLPRRMAICAEQPMPPLNTSSFEPSPIQLRRRLRQFRVLFYFHIGSSFSVGFHRIQTKNERAHGVVAGARASRVLRWASCPARRDGLSRITTPFALCAALCRAGCPPRHAGRARSPRGCSGDALARPAVSFSPRVIAAKRIQHPIGADDVGAAAVYAVFVPCPGVHEGLYEEPEGVRGV